MLTEELEYDLPEELIATNPIEPRDSARLLVISRSDPDLLEHRVVRELPDLLPSDATLVFNSTRVIPARFTGYRADTRGRVQGLVVGEANHRAAVPGGQHLVVMLRARRMKAGVNVIVLDRQGSRSGLILEVEGRDDDEPAAWRVRVRGGTAQDVLDRAGLTPLPPYILHARKMHDEACDDAADREHYQTVYASEAGSVAAPTAGLHFTPDLLRRVEARGIARTDVVLHVGTGTFRPIESPTVESHPMHAEWCELTGGTGSLIRRRLAGVGGPVVAVGTTSARTIESFAARARREGSGPEDLRGWMETRLLISPGYEWLATDGLMTNFHLPRSTLLAMVAALVPGGIERVLDVYAEAVAHRYRFYSFGDAMLVLP